MRRSFLVFPRLDPTMESMDTQNLRTSLASHFIPSICGFPLRQQANSKLWKVPCILYKADKIHGDPLIYEIIEKNINFWDLYFPLELEAFIIPIIDPRHSNEQSIKYANLQRDVATRFFKHIRKRDPEARIIIPIIRTVETISPVTELLDAEVTSEAELVYCKSDLSALVDKVGRVDATIQREENDLDKILSYELDIENVGARAKISLDNIGVNHYAPLQYLLELSRFLIDHLTDFTIWISIGDIVSGEDGLLSRVAVGDIVLSSNSYKAGEQFKRSYFPYIEINDYVYDGVVALKKPIPLLEFQGKLNTQTHHSLLIKAGTSFQGVVASVLDILDKINKGAI
jgi:hypothetical protein